MSATHHPVIRVKSLFFVPVDVPDHVVDLSDFSDESSVMFGDAVFLDLPYEDMYQTIEGQDYIVVQIPEWRNGEMLNDDGIVDGELKRTIKYLESKGLREDAVFPGLVMRDSFNFDLQAVGR